MKTKIIIAISAALLLFAYIYLSESETTEIPRELLQSSSQLITPVDSNEPIEHQDLTVKITENEQAETPRELVQETNSQAAFSGISRTSTEAKAYLEAAGVLPQDLNGEAYVEFDLQALRALEIGDTFNLDIPQTLETFSAEVTNTTIFDNGDKSVFGRLVGSDGVLHTTVLTVGADALYGQLTAPSGNYVFETKEQYGWIAAKRDLYQSHIESEAVPVPADELIVIEPEPAQASDTPL
ncbi:hypothetical protein [Aliikangiella sp. IMCC44632]